MKTLNKRVVACPFCLKVHEVAVIEDNDSGVFKGEDIEYKSHYLFCEESDSYFEDEIAITENDIVLKDAYREKMGLLKSKDIIEIRNRYEISQNDLCEILKWGKKTITRYEGHQIQDKAHDMILRKISEDPSWYIELLNESRASFAEDVYRKYSEKALAIYEKCEDYYLRKLISANCSNYARNPKYTGNTHLSFSKIADVIKYYASSEEVTSLYKVKLMKMMWYADFISYKKRNHAITGLPYIALPMGAVPESHDYIIKLKGVPCEIRQINEAEAYFFHTNEKNYPTLTNEDKEILDIVISVIGKWDTKKIVDHMHKEIAFKKTPQNCAISYDYAKYIDLNN